MVPHKILKRLKLTEGKSVATVVADDDRSISKAVDQERYLDKYIYIFALSFY